MVVWQVLHIVVVTKGGNLPSLADLDAQHAQKQHRAREQALLLAARAQRGRGEQPHEPLDVRLAELRARRCVCV